MARCSHFGGKKSRGSQCKHEARPGKKWCAMCANRGSRREACSERKIYMHKKYLEGKAGNPPKWLSEQIDSDREFARKNFVQPSEEAAQ